MEFSENNINKVCLSFYETSSDFDNCDLESSQLEFLNSTTTIDNCDMEYSNIVSTSLDLDPTDSITIRNNTISNSLVPAISITANRNVEIKNNTIENNYIGIELFETKSVDIIDNNIRHNDQGLYLYHSIITSVSGSNDISSNSNNYANNRDPQGLYAAHNCSWELLGNTQNDYQMIVNNGKGNLFFEDYSTPAPFKYNIIHTNVGTHPYLEIDEFAQSPTYYAQNNYWGTSFDPLTDLVPYADIVYLPIWSPGTPPPQIEYDVAEALYYDAIDNETNEEYALAELKYKDIIANYSTT
ncbi:MAG: right-handed parallel beta-helix repeat-containing protein, partial [Candidatus Zophobacter franzmannii]|nr:right-handed parallel beta-helix repeat-containing protein [Candidatus Zophobacter franzmannii]